MAIKKNFAALGLCGISPVSEVFNKTTYGGCTLKTQVVIFNSSFVIHFYYISHFLYHFW